MGYNYLYNGKEWLADFSFYDYGAKGYHADVARWFSVDPLGEEMPSYSPYNYAFNNPVYFIDPDGKSPINPIKVRVFNMEKGTTNNFSINNKSHIIPASNQSWSGSITSGSITKDRGNLIGLILDVNSTYIRSVSLTTSKNTGQYFNNKNEKVENMVDATKLIISKYSKTETINLTETMIKDEMVINESIGTIIFEVVDGEYLSFTDSSYNPITKNKNKSQSSDILSQMVNAFLLENKFQHEMHVKKIQAAEFINHAENSYHDMQRESKQKSPSNIFD